MSKEAYNPSGEVKTSKYERLLLFDNLVCLKSWLEMDEAPFRPKIHDIMKQF